MGSFDRHVDLVPSGRDGTDEYRPGDPACTSALHGLTTASPRQAALERLIDGYRSFRDNFFSRNRDTFARLAQGQAPEIMMISCCDSRVEPAIIFETGPGEIFAVRNVANLVPPLTPDGSAHGTIAAIEFAVCMLQVGHIVVLGHSCCGGVRALLSAHEGTAIGRWLQTAASARSAAVGASCSGARATLQRVCEYEVIRTSLVNIREFPFVRERTRLGRLSLHGWHFDIETGELQALDPEADEFVTLS
ncbi:carbonic anhydrase [Rhodoplanes sp. TEM]|uniref:Carbonic anhydrase n=1 Tax=Rhodoplanes tepidamans TaxID=200616 RepID=A0ABT5JAF6_RHOTP|nr:MULTISPECIES: carbonic anhydrase [Rhodoplanes]MDC7786639.1 carbonic anhydrase [Rhodoplanes tepidamans]MDC7983014.1 carbonic anhydrase [Rhodoplanes sp. TEM]MDQ0356396.1 carbonic anhydrase [Rhodoplanes tepidamans]